MSTEIDSLSVKIEAEGKEASDSLSKLASSFDKLAGKVENIKKLTSSMTKLQQAISGISSKQVSTLNKLTKSLSKLNGNIKLPSLNSFAKGIERISNTDLTAFEEQMKRIAAAVQELNTSAADGDLRSFVSDLAAVARNADRAARAVQSASRGAVGNNSPPPTVTDTSAIISNPVAATFSGLSTGINAATGSLDSFAVKLASVARTAAGGAIQAIPKLFFSMAHPIQTASNLFERMKSGLSGVTGGFQKARSASNGFSNNLLTIIARSVMYSAIFSGISMVTNGVSTGILNLYYANAQFAASMDRCATEAQYLQNSIAAALSPAIEALTPVIEFVVDRFVDLINVVNMCIATITGQSTWTRAVKTPATYADALDGVSDSATGAKKATDAASDAAEEYKRTLMGFDEINKLDDPTSSSGSSGSGGTGGSGAGTSIPDYASMFTTEQIALNSTEFGAALQDFINQLKEKIAAEDWTGVGVVLADGFGQAVDYLDEFITSPTLQNKIYKAVDALTDVINGFFGEMAYSDGTRDSIATRTGDLIGDAISLALNTIDRFLTRVKWSNIGRAVAQGINGAIVSLNENDVSFGTILADLLNAGINGISGFADELSWSEIGEFIAGNVNDFFTTVDWKQAGATASDLISGLAEMINSAIALIDDDAVGQAFTDFFSGINLIDIGQAFGFEYVGPEMALKLLLQDWAETGKEIATLIFGEPFLHDLEADLQRAWESVTDFFSRLLDSFTDFYAECGGDIFQGILNGIGAAVSNLGSWIKTNIFNPFIDWFKRVFGIASPAKAPELLEAASYVGEGILNGILQPFKNIASWVKKNILDPITKALGGNGLSIEAAVKLVKDGWSTVEKWIGSIPVLSQALKLIKSGWSTVKGWIGSIPTISQLVKLAKSGWSTVKSWVGTMPVLSAGIKLVKSGWTSVKSWLGDLTAKFNIQLPKVSVTWSGSPIKLPHFSVKWNAQGGILDGATLFGMAGNTLLGGGEAGREAILPLDRNTGWMDTFADKVAQRVSSGSGGSQTITVYVTLDGKVVGKSVVNYVNGVAKSTGVNPLSAYI